MGLLMFSQFQFIAEPVSELAPPFKQNSQSHDTKQFVRKSFKYILYELRLEDVNKLFISLSIFTFLLTFSHTTRIVF